MTGKVLACRTGKKPGIPAYFGDLIVLPGPQFDHAEPIRRDQPGNPGYDLAVGCKAVPTPI